MKEFFQSFSQVITSMYNQYILADFLGYILPGALLLLNVNYYVPFLVRLKSSFSNFPAISKYFVPIFFIGICYLIGQMIPGYFFHAFRHVSWWPWRYFPYESINDYVSQFQFEIEYQTALKIINNPAITMGNQRFVILKQLTGYNSAALLLMSLINLVFIQRHFKQRLYAKGVLLVIAPILISIGLLINSYALMFSSYQYKENTIREAIAINKYYSEIDSIQLQKLVNSNSDTAFIKFENTNNHKCLWFLHHK